MSVALAVSSPEPAFNAFAGLHPIPDQIPEALKHVPQWVVWKAEPKPQGGTSKIPYQPNGRKASSTDPNTWSDYEAAWSAYEESPAIYGGIGFVLAKDDTFIGGDLDHCRDAETGELTAMAKKIVDGIDTYWEVSPSGCGLRFIAKGEQVTSFKGQGIEIYTAGRYLTLTGERMNGCTEPKEITRGVLDRLHAIAKPGSSRAVERNDATQADDPVVAALKANSLYLKAGEAGRHNIICPWGKEHSGGDLSGTVYMEANHNGYPYARFKCQHSHGDGYNLTDLEAYLGIGADPETAQAPSVVRDPVAWMDSFKISRKTMDNIANPEWIYENLVIQGHVVAIVAAPNGGKTTIMLQVAADMAAHGYRVIYVNADTSGGDAKSMKDFADESGFEMLLPDLVAGKSMKDVVENLKAMSTVDADMSKLVFIFDTLKKMTNVINKSQAADLYKTFRSLTGKGVTSILLAHTNKYKDSEGKPVYEGTGDLRADADELIYLTGDKKADGTMTVSTDPDKVRGAFKPISFNIDVERNVTRCGYVDVGEEVRRKRQYETDRDAIEVITETLGGATVGKTELLNDVRKNGIGRNRARRVLERYCGNDAYVQCWVKEIGFANNVIKFRKIKTVLVSSDHTSVGGENEQ